MASGGSFGLWPKLMPLPVSTRGHVLIGLAQIWVLQVAPFPCQMRCESNDFYYAQDGTKKMRTEGVKKHAMIIIS